MNRQLERSSATIGAILSAARRLFASGGFELTSIDDIAARAAVAKGAIYHHFASKELIFERVLDSLQAEIAASLFPGGAAPQIADPLDGIAAGVQRYLDAAMQPGVKRILLLDGPVVIGWGKWREIDERYFGAGTRAALAHAYKDLAPREIDALAHLVAGAVMEAALLCATSLDPGKSARVHVSALRKLLEGPRRSVRPPATRTPPGH